MAARQKKSIPAEKDIVPLLQAARTGSGEALGQLLAAYRSFLLAAATEELDTELKAKAGPSDLVQETFIDAQRNFASFESDNEVAFRTWLHTILMNNMADLRRRYFKAAKRQVHRERPLGTSDSKRLSIELAALDGNSPSRAAISSEETQRLNQALERLSPAYRQVILMRGRQRHTFAEIAEQIGRSSDAVRMLWQRAIARLQRELGENHDRKA